MKEEGIVMKVVKIRMRLCPQWVSPSSQGENNSSLCSLHLIPQLGLLPILAVYSSKG